MKNFVISNNPQLDLLREKLVKLYERKTNCSEIYMLGFYSLFGSMPLSKFRSLSRAFHDFVMINEVALYRNLTQSTGYDPKKQKEETEKLHADLTAAVQKFADIMEDNDIDVLMEELAEEQRAGRLTKTALAERFPDITDDALKQIKNSILHYVSEQDGYKILKDTVQNSLLLSKS